MRSESESLLNGGVDNVALISASASIRTQLKKEEPLVRKLLTGTAPTILEIKQDLDALRSKVASFATVVIKETVLMFEV